MARATVQRRLLNIIGCSQQETEAVMLSSKAALFLYLFAFTCFFLPIIINYFRLKKLIDLLKFGGNVGIGKIEERIYHWWVIKLSNIQRKALMIIICCLYSLCHVYFFNYLEKISFEKHDCFEATTLFLGCMFFAWFSTRALKDRFAEKENNTRDPLTNLNNRRYMQESLDRLKKQVARDNRNGLQSRLALIFMDMNDLKKINDDYGHLAGDTAICNTAAIISREIRQDLENYLCRYGGDEFCAAIKFNDCKTSHQLIKGVARIAGRIKRNLRSHPSHYGKFQIPLAITIGIHEVDTSKNIMDELAVAAKMMEDKKKRLKIGRHK